MTPEKLLLTFENNADSNLATPMAKYMKNHFAFYGIPSPKRKELQKEFIQAQKKLKSIDWDALYFLWENGRREIHYVVLDCLWTLKGKLQLIDLPHLKNLIETHSWWDSVDCVDQLVGVLFKKYPKALKTELLEWSMSQNFWLKRVSINCQLGFKTTTDWDFLQTVLLHNLAEKEFFVAKAVGWSLRDYARHAPETVINFLLTNHQNMQALSVREANKHLRISL
jgi:3-methyladenine DNA glycosylase AlkD